jgi:exosortase
LNAEGQEPSRQRLLGLVAAGMSALAFAYRDLLTLGSGRYGELATEVEFWLFVPNDRAPLVVLVLAGWLAYRRWPRLSTLPGSSAPIWAVGGFLAAGALSFAWAIHVAAEDLQAISLIANVAGLVLLGWGRAGLRVMWLPIAFLLFCIPVPAPMLVSLLWEMRIWTADYTGWLLYLLGIPAYISGDQILRATQSFQVIEGCSGLRSIETLTMLVVLLVELFHRRGAHAALLLLSAPFVAFALNGVRVLTLVLNPHGEIVAIHSLQGIAILLVGLLVVYGLDTVLAHILAGRPHAGPAASGAVEQRIRPLRLATTLLAVSLIVVGLSFWTPVWTAPRPARTLEKLVDDALAGWSWTEIPAETYFLGRTHFREVVHRSYQTSRGHVEVFVGTSDPRDRSSSIISRISAVPGTGWEVRESLHDVSLPDGPAVVAQLVEKGTERRLVYHWVVGSWGILVEAARSFLGFDRSELRRPDAQLSVRLSTRIGSGNSEERGRAEQRLEVVYSQLEPALADARELVPYQASSPVPAAPSSPD